MHLKEFIAEPATHAALIEFGALAIRTYAALQERQQIMVGADAPLANVRSDITRLVMEALDTAGQPELADRTDLPAWLINLWTEKGGT